ncbi:DUF5103 domain-containing protein [Flavobacterium longum]
MPNMKLTYLLLLATLFSVAQKQTELQPPFNIKTVQFVQSGQVTSPVFLLTDSFQFEFDDLYGNEANYYYEIVHCNYDWTPSDLAEAEYLQGFDNQRIQDYTNSLTTLQLYSHYKLAFPNRFTKFKVTGNYLLKILNEAHEVVFSRKFVLYEDRVSVPLQIKRARSMDLIEQKQNLDFAIKSQNITFINPLTNVKVMLIQNGRLDNVITNVKPQFTIGNDLIYRYDAQTQFWGGNEFRFFENKDIRAANNNIIKIDPGKDNGTYSAYLYRAEARGNQPYTFAPDINGRYLVNNIGATNNAIEADYAWIYFSLSAPSLFTNKDVYINGMFNNFALSEENKMDYNADKGIYEKALMIKQGFTNYQFVVADKKGVVDYKAAVDGNFWQTENDYIVLVYYREPNGRYDKVIGRGYANSEGITN